VHILVSLYLSNFTTYCPSINGLLAQSLRSAQKLHGVKRQRYSINIRYMPAVIFFAGLDLEQKFSFLDKPYLRPVGQY